MAVGDVLHTFCISFVADLQEIALELVYTNIAPTAMANLYKYHKQVVSNNPLWLLLCIKPFIYLNLNNGYQDWGHLFTLSTSILIVIYLVIGLVALVFLVIFLCSNFFDIFSFNIIWMGSKQSKLKQNANHMRKQQLK